MDNPRLDRIEGILETIVKVRSDLQQERRTLLRAQVAQADEMRQMAKRTDERLAAAEERRAAAEARRDAALAALMRTVDEIIRRKQ